MDRWWRFCFRKHFCYDLKIGRNEHNLIDFTTDNKITFRVNQNDIGSFTESSGNFILKNIDTAHDTAGKSLTISGGTTTAGTTNNIAGGDLTLQGGQGKGTGSGGNIVFKVSNAVGSDSSTLNIYDTALTIYDDKSANFGGNIVIEPNGGNTGSIQFKELDGNGSNYVGLKAPDEITSNLTWTLPSADGTTNQVLKTNGSGVLGWASAGGSNLGSPSSAPANNDGSEGDMKLVQDSGSYSYVRVASGQTGGTSLNREE